MLWVTNRMVVPVSRQMRSSSSFSRSRVISSSAPNGSSISRISGRRAGRARSRRAGACRRTIRAAAHSPSRRGRPAPAVPPGAARCRRRRAPPPTCNGSRTLSSALRQGSSVASWNTKPISRRWRAAAGAWPSTRTLPAAGCDDVGDHPQQRGLAAAGRAKQRQETAGGRGSSRTSSQRGDLALLAHEPHGHVAQSTAGSRRGRCRASWRGRRASPCQPILGRVPAVALRMASVITSSSFGVRLVNWPSLAYRSIWSCHTAGSIVP